MPHDTTDTSVLVSLQELVSLEHERLREEEAERENARREAERARRLAEEQQRAAEEARQAAEQEARRQRRQAAAEEAARLDALKQAEIVRARVAAEAAARRERETLELQHRSELHRLQQARHTRRWRVGLAAGLLVAVVAGGVVAVQVVGNLERQQAAQEDRNRRLELEQQRYLSDRLAVLDRVAEAMRDKLETLDPLPAELSAAEAEVRRLRASLSPGALEQVEVDALEQAQQALAEALARTHRRRQLESLDALRAELHAAVVAVRRPGVELSRADARVEALRNGIESSDPDGAALQRMASALEDLAREVTKVSSAKPSSSVSPPSQPPQPERPCDPADPMEFRLCGH